ncbi:MAG: hypothetical protein KDK37_10650 [Leptospiraceae bacterium]|nr:hypothetical protein [Leptospiraceae bacterium]
MRGNCYQAKRKEPLYGLRLVGIALLSWMTLAGCATTDPAIFITENSAYYPGTISLGSMEGSTEMEFIVEEGAWQGFKTRSFQLRFIIRQGVAVSIKTEPYEAIAQPYKMENPVVFRFPIRDVSWTSRGPSERMNLNRSFSGCLQLQDLNSEAILASQCFDVDDHTIALTESSGAIQSTALVEESKPDKKVNSGGFDGLYVSGDAIKELGPGVLKLNGTAAQWIPSEKNAGKPVLGSCEEQGELLLVRFGDTLLLLRRSEGGLDELNRKMYFRRLPD